MTDNILMPYFTGPLPRKELIYTLFSKKDLSNLVSITEKWASWSVTLTHLFLMFKTELGNDQNAFDRK